jgi:hypothetical protein
MLGNDSSSNLYFYPDANQCAIDTTLSMNINAIAPTFNNAIADVYYDHTQQSKFYQWNNWNLESVKWCCKYNTTVIYPHTRCIGAN